MLDGIAENQYTKVVDPFLDAAVPTSAGNPSGVQRLVSALRERAFAIALTAAFLVLATLGALHHELWRDELHAWLVARDSANLWNVFQVTRYEAHFVLWRVLLFGITRFTHNPFALQLLNLLLATTTIWIVARFSPFRKLEKCLLSFGYFFFYEFCIIAQDYTLVVVLMFCFCALYRRRAENVLALSVVLFLLANAAPYGLLIVLIFSALLVFSWIRDEEDPSLRTASHRRVGALIVLVGVASATLQILLIKPSPSTSWKHPLTVAGLSDTMINIWRAYVPFTQGFPSLDRWPWGTNLIDSIPVALPIKVGLSLLLGLVSVALLLKRPSGLFLYLVGLAILWPIQFLVNAGALRHKGFLFLLFVAALWIGGDTAEWQLSDIPVRRLGDFFGRWRNPFIVGLLVIQVIAGMYAFKADWGYAFSADKETAQFLRDHGLTNLPIAASDEMQVAPLSAYLDKPIYFLQSSRFGTYADLSRSLDDLSVREMLKRSVQLAHRMRTDVVLVIANGTIELQQPGVWLESGSLNADGVVLPSSAPELSPSATIQFVGQFPCYVDESYSVYLIQPN